MIKKRSAENSVIAVIGAIKNGLYQNRQQVQSAVGCGTRATKVLWDMGVIKVNDGFLYVVDNPPPLAEIMKRYYSNEPSKPKQLKLELTVGQEHSEQRLLGLIRSIAEKLPLNSTIEIRHTGAWQIKSDGF